MLSFVASLENRQGLSSWLVKWAPGCTRGGSDWVLEENSSLKAWLGIERTVTLSHTENSPEDEGLPIRKASC